MHPLSSFRGGSPAKSHGLPSLIETALAADPNNVRALGVKGAILNSQGENGFARDALDKGLAAKSDDPQLLHERSVAQQAIARADMLAAGALRDIKISRVDNGDGTETVTTVYPSQADLAKAAQFEAEAKVCGQKAREDMAAAMKLTAGTAINAYWQGLTDYAYHDLKQAKADYEQAVKLDPKFRAAWEELGRVDWELKLPQDWAAARVGAIGPIQTTAGPWLTVARNEISSAQFKEARDSLAAARQARPSRRQGLCLSRRRRGR